MPRQYVKIIKLLILSCALLTALSACQPAADEKAFESVSEYLESEDGKEYKEMLTAGTAEEVFEIEGTLDTVIYTFTVPDDVDKESFSQNISQAVSEQKDVYIQQANSMLEFVNQNPIKLIIRYADEEGAILYEGEFESDK